MSLKFTLILSFIFILGLYGRSQTIYTIAGRNTSTDYIPAKSATFNLPSCIKLDGKGNMFIADKSNNRIRRIDAQTGIVTTVAGNGSVGFSGDGNLATLANLILQQV